MTTVGAAPMKKKPTNIVKFGPDSSAADCSELQIPFTSVSLADLQAVQF